MQLVHEGWVQQESAGAAGVELYDPADFAGEAVFKACG
jgi:hypothetical protein